MNFEIILGIACFGAVLQEVPLYQTLLEKLKIDFKPFNCALCFTFWLSLPILIFTEGAVGIFNSITAAVLAELISRQLNRL
jgi:hypothetical protein